MEQSKKEKFALEKKEAYEAIGEFVVQFEHLSYSIKHKISMICGSSKMTGPLLEPYAFRQSVGVLENIIDILTEGWPKEHPDIKLYDQLIRDLNKLNNDRNSLIHSMWLIGWASGKTESVSDYIGQKYNGPFKNSSTSYVQELVEKCKNFYSVFWTIWSIDRPEISEGVIFSDLYERTDKGRWIKKNKM